MAKSRSPKWAEVICPIHGTKDTDRPFMPPVIKVATPKSKKDRVSGCPICKRNAGVPKIT